MRERRRQAIAAAIAANRVRAAVAGLGRYPQRIEPPEKNWKKLLNVSRTRSNLGGFILSQPCVTRQRPSDSSTVKYHGKIANPTRKMQINKRWRWNFPGRSTRNATI